MVKWVNGSPVVQTQYGNNINVSTSNLEISFSEFVPSDEIIPSGSGTDSTNIIFVNNSTENAIGSTSYGPAKVLPRSPRN